MSVQSILEISRERYLQEAEERLLQMSDAYFFKKKFLLGDGVDRDKLNHTMQNHRFLCTDNCEMIKFIKDKIEGNLEPAKRKTGVKRLQDLLQQIKHEFNCTDQEALEQVMHWQEVEW